jgi:hypothetical protein
MSNARRTGKGFVPDRHAASPAFVFARLGALEAVRDIGESTEYFAEHKACDGGIVEGGDRERETASRSAYPDRLPSG